MSTRIPYRLGDLNTDEAAPDSQLGVHAGAVAAVLIRTAQDLDGLAFRRQVSDEPIERLVLNGLPVLPSSDGLTSFR